ncbi:Uncharacterised protein [Klebsiella pneumoniae]|nr:Uncharacterised protein [Klebsiella pneumoniae]VED58263.1 Uncharacterised protein [Klebsiella aerogenes]SBX95804.1 Uncharacterised protein [Klebsiella pneumoniae]SLY43373.1 Uncharacterised protein [Klebsiella pneumoniae]SLY99863.1 Uncharacterised protein [Klebsiella pneumoniae]
MKICFPGLLTNIHTKFMVIKRSKSSFFDW